MCHLSVYWTTNSHLVFFWITSSVSSIRVNGCSTMHGYFTLLVFFCCLIYWCELRSDLEMSMAALMMSSLALQIYRTALGSLPGWRCEFRILAAIFLFASWKMCLRFWRFVGISEHLLAFWNVCWRLDGFMHDGFLHQLTFASGKFANKFWSASSSHHACWCLGFSIQAKVHTICDKVRTTHSVAKNVRITLSIASTIKSTTCRPCIRDQWNLRPVFWQESVTDKMSLNDKLGWWLPLSFALCAAWLLTIYQF